MKLFLLMLYALRNVRKISLFDFLSNLKTNKFDILEIDETSRHYFRKFHFRIYAISCVNLSYSMRENC